MRPKQSNEKSAALREHGALNPRPDDVTDALFQSEEFFDPKDLVQVKYEMVRRVKHDRQTVTEAAAAFGFSRPSFYQAQAALASEGLPGLLPERPGPRRAHKLSDEVMNFIEEVKSENEALRPIEIAQLIKERFGVSVHQRSIERAWARRQKKIQQPREQDSCL
jgi:transposase